MTARPTPDELRKAAQGKRRAAENVAAVFPGDAKGYGHDAEMLETGADAMERVERLEEALWEIVQQGGHPTDETWCQRKASMALAQEGGDG